MGSCIRRISVEIIEEALSLMSDDERTSYLISSSEAQIALLEKLFVKKKGTTLTKLQEEKAVEIVKEYLESKKKD